MPAATHTNAMSAATPTLAVDPSVSLSSVFRAFAASVLTTTAGLKQAMLIDLKTGVQCDKP